MSSQPGTLDVRNFSVDERVTALSALYWSIFPVRNRFLE